MNITKRLLSMLLAVVMVISMIPAVFAAEEAVLISSTEELDAQIDLLATATAGMTLKLQLTQNVVMDKAILLPYNETASKVHNVTLDLAGFKLTSEAAIRAFEVRGGTLTVTDTVGGGAVELPGIHNTATTSYDKTADPTAELVNAGGLILVYGSAKCPSVLNLNNVTVKKVATDNAVNTGGVALVRNYATLNMKDSHIVVAEDETVDAANGGAITSTSYTGTPVINMDNSTVSGGKATNYGGNVTISGLSRFTMINGSEVYGGYVTPTGSHGGGNFYTANPNTVLTLTDSKIYGGEAPWGGNIRENAGTLIINGNSEIYGGVSIDTNSTANYGGNILIYTSGTVIMNGGKVYNGTVVNTNADYKQSVYGGNICVFGGKLTINGGEIYGGSVKTAYGSSYGGNVALQQYSKKYYPVAVMNGGKIYSGSSTGTTSDVYAGNLAILNGRFILNDGEIYGGTANKGANIQTFNAATADGTATDVFHMYGGKIDAIAGIATRTKVHAGLSKAKISTQLASCSSISSAKNEDGYYEITHNNNDGTENDVAATCTEAGKINVTCTSCTVTVDEITYGGTYAYETAALGHAIVSHEAKAPTCNDIGWNAYEDCSRCDYTTYEELAAAGHSYGAVVTAPSCEDQGYTTYTCSACGDSYVDDYTAQTGHAWGEGVTTTAPTCDNAGVKTYTCGNCGETKTETLAAAGHSYDAVVTAPSCEDQGYTTYTCSACGDSYVDDYTEKTGHAWDAGVYTEPTFEADGYTTYTCGTCGATKTEVEEGSQLQKKLPEATVTELNQKVLENGEYRVWNGIASDNESEALVVGVGKLPLEAVVNLKANDTLEECLAGGYSDWLVDFNITVEGLENGSFTADNCYLAGNYGSFGWIKIPLDGRTISEGVTYPVVALYDPTLNYKDICKSVKDFTAALHIDQAILDANPNLTVKLELVMTNPNDATDTMQIDEDIIYTAAELKNLRVPQAEVTPMGKVTLEDGGYRVWNGVVSDKESEALVDGVGELPLEVVVNFKAIDTLEECLAGGYAKWLVDFNITVNGLANGSFVGDHCYLAGNYGSYGWIKIPLDGQTISEGIAYPVVALYDPTLNYKDICKSVKDFTAAIHIDQAILDANPDLEIKLELVMTNPDDATDTMQIGEDLIYTFDELSSGIVAQNVQTGVVYSNVATALTEAKAGQTVILLADCESAGVLLSAGKTLDLNGYTLTSGLVAAPYANTYVIDNTDGKGLLVTNRDSLAVLNENAYLPVWTAEGYRFVSVSMRQSLKRKDNGDAYLRFFIEGNDATCALQQALADGGADNGVYVCVKMNWTDNNGNVGSRNFIFSEELVKDYAADWTGNEFRLTVTGMDKVSELSLTPQVVYDLNDVTEDGFTVTRAGNTQTLNG